MVRSLRLAPLTLVLVAGAAVSATAFRPTPVVERAEGSPIHEHMETMNAALKFFAKTGASAENRVKAFEQLEKFQASVVACKSMTPETAKAVEEAKRAEFVAGYRSMLVDALSNSCRMEKALLEGKYDDANRIAREDMNALKKAGHDKYEGDDH